MKRQAAHREWVERVCSIAGFKAVLPLWNRDREMHIQDFLSSRYRAAVISVREDALDRKWLSATWTRRRLTLFEKQALTYVEKKGNTIPLFLTAPCLRNPSNLFRDESKIMEATPSWS